MLVLFVPWFNAITGWFFTAPGGDAELPMAPESSATPSGEEAALSARVIEFYVPATFQLPERRWVPSEERGKVIEFPAQRKKSA